MQPSGYQDGSDQLGDYAVRFAILFDRLLLVRGAMPNAAAVVTPAESAAALAGIAPELEAIDARLRAHDEAVAQRTAEALRRGVALPLERLRQRLGLEPLDVHILTMAAAMEDGSAFNQYRTRSQNYETMQADLAFLMALLAPADARLSERVRARFTQDAPLIESGAIVLSPGAGWAVDSPLIHKRVRLADRVLDFLRGIEAPGRSVLGAAGRFVPAPAGAAELFVDDPAMLAALKSALEAPDQLAMVRGIPGVGRKALVGAVAHQLGRPLLIVDLPRLSVEPTELVRTLTPLLAEARLQGAVLVLDDVDRFATGENQQTLWPLVTDRVARLQLPLALVCVRNPQWLDRIPRVALEFDVPFTSRETQRRMWVRHLPPTLQLEGALSIEQVTKSYSLSCGAIIAVTDRLRRLDNINGASGRLTQEQLLHAVRGQLSHQLGTLAEPVTTNLGWDDVVLPDDVIERVVEFLNYAHHRERIMRGWGFGRKLAYGRGLSALFSGPPGTGKTMICSLLAKELGMELYRIDLSKVVNKYIGETEKNLGKLFDEAGRGQVMLLFDEADSLFAKRTEIKSSHDRYANLEVNYLLQRMEAFDGMVVLTTNAESSLDRAFLRRIRFRVQFPAPKVADRERLWRTLMPKEMELDSDVDFAELAERFAMAGGNIMNALVRAATAASAAARPVTQANLMWAAQLEYGEMGFLA